MRKKFFCCLLVLIKIFAYGQSDYDLYIVNDPDGYVNKRSGPGLEHDISGEINNKTILIHYKDRPVTNGWVPVSKIYKESEGKIYKGTYSYIYKNRLKLLDRGASQKINKILLSSSIYGPLNVQLLSDSMPDILVMNNEGDCELQVIDINKNHTILSTGIPVCFDIIQGDTLTFSCMYEGGYPRAPMFTIYKIYKKKNGDYDFYTEIFPEPRKVSKEKAEEMVSSIRKDIKESLGNNKFLFYQLPDFYKYCGQLFTAYCSGVDALDIIHDSGCDASICHSLDDFSAMIEAYNKSKNRE